MRDFLVRLKESFVLVGGYVPAMLGAFAILFVGYLIARLVQKGVAGALRRLHFNAMAERGGVVRALEHSGSPFNPTLVVANLAFWFVMFAVLLIAANALGLESLSQVLRELVSYIPSVIAAIVIVIVGIVLGGFVGGVILASAGAIEGGLTLARVGRSGVILLAVFMALQQLGVATDVVTTAVTIVFGAAALALALAFGLGNRDLAGEITRQWWTRYAAERAALAAEAAAADQEVLGGETGEAPVPATTTGVGA